MSFEPYQCYFQRYAKNFFANIQVFSDPYVNTLLILKAILYKCSFFKVEDFNLDDIKFFLTINMPLNIVFPDFELVALRCFFYYEILKEYLKLKPVENNFLNIEKSINLELNIIYYKPSNKEIFITGIYDLLESLNKLENKYANFLKKKSEDKESNVNEALVSLKLMNDEIRLISTKSKNLINNKYIHLTKMRRLLTIINNENHRPRFLEAFNKKVRNDFILNEMGKTEAIEKNKEALNQLFHTICQDEFCTPFNKEIEQFIKEMIADYPKDDISVLEDIELEDLIEFSFYYIFILFYTKFKESLNGTNTKLLYTQMVTYTIYINIKLDALELLEGRRDENINRFLSKVFKNKIEYFHNKKNILDEINLNLEVMKDILCLLHEAKKVEVTVRPLLISSLVPTPEEKTLTDLFKKLEKKQKKCENEYKKINSYEFICRPKSEKIDENSEPIRRFSESLFCLSENFLEILSFIKEDAKDLRKLRQQNSSVMNRISLSINNLFFSINSWKNIDETTSLESLSFPELLEESNKFIIENSLAKKKYKKKADFARYS